MDTCNAVGGDEALGAILHNVIIGQPLQGKTAAKSFIYTCFHCSLATLSGRFRGRCPYNSTLCKIALGWEFGIGFSWVALMGGSLVLAASYSFPCFCTACGKNNVPPEVKAKTKPGRTTGGRLRAGWATVAFSFFFFFLFLIYFIGWYFCNCSDRSCRFSF